MTYEDVLSERKLTVGDRLALACVGLHQRFPGSMFYVHEECVYARPRSGPDFRVQTISQVDDFNAGNDGWGKTMTAQAELRRIKLLMEKYDASV